MVARENKQNNPLASRLISNDNCLNSEKEPSGLEGSDDLPHENKIQQDFHIELVLLAVGVIYTIALNFFGFYGVYKWFVG